jgi:ATP-dependent DNA helicase HFM1/MER3
MEDFASSQLIITTPEKWDAITRKWRDNISLISRISLILIDEVHLLNTEERGGTLEAVVSRMKIIGKELNKNQNMRIIAVSATIPNIHDIAEWLEVDKTNIKVFGEEYRPVALEKHVFGYNYTKSEFLFEKNLNFRLLEIVRKFSEKRPTLVFCQYNKQT